MNGSAWADLAPYPPATDYGRRRFEVLFKWQRCMGDRRWPGADPLARHDSLTCLQCSLERLAMGYERRN